MGLNGSVRGPPVSEGEGNGHRPVGGRRLLKSGVRKYQQSLPASLGNLHFDTACSSCAAIIRVVSSQLRCHQCPLPTSLTRRHVAGRSGYRQRGRSIENDSCATETHHVPLREIIRRPTSPRANRASQQLDQAAIGDTNRCTLPNLRRRL